MTEAIAAIGVQGAVFEEPVPELEAAPGAEPGVLLLFIVAESGALLDGLAEVAPGAVLVL
ncbi:MAG TPA: hypothetical protein VMU41_18870 [Candidatus Binataceae bacterium]|nr:hypothetical protein [Candidatus Binataceae bacterium]